MKSKEAFIENKGVMPDYCSSVAEKLGFTVPELESRTSYTPIPSWPLSLPTDLPAQPVSWNSEAMPQIPVFDPNLTSSTDSTEPQPPPTRPNTVPQKG